MPRVAAVIRLLLVRHGESEWNVAGRVQGQAAGVRLTPRGREQADAVARELAGCGAALLVSSDLERALETGSIALIEATGNAIAPAWYMVAISVVAFIAMCMTHDNSKKKLTEIQ